MRFIRQRTCTAALIVIEFFLVAWTTHGQEDVTALVARDYPTALKKLEREFVPMHGTVQEKSQLLDGSTIKKTINYWFNADSKKVQVILYIADDPPQETIYCSSPKSSFVLTKKDGSYRVKDLPSQRDAEREIGLQVGFALLPSWRINPYSLVPIDDPLASISEAIETRKYQLAGAVRSTSDGKPFIDIKYNYTLKNGQKTILAADRLRVSPDDGWALHRMETDIREPGGGTKREGVRSIEIRYRPDANPIRIPEVVEVKRSAMELNRFEFGDVHFEATPEREFSTSYYGLPELRKVPEKGSRFGSAFWFLVVSAVCLALGIALRRLGKRQGRGDPSQATI